MQKNSFAMDPSTKSSITTPTSVLGDRPALQSRLENVIEEIIADHRILDGPERDQAAEFARQQLCKLFDCPKVSELQLVLRKTITVEEARHILFFPDEDQAAHYPRLIAEPPPEAPPGHPQRELQIPHLSLLYLQHWKRWDFLSPFVLAGGLNALCGLFTHSNPIVRMKAISTFATVTSHTCFDWFQPPRGSTEAKLHQALLDLRAEPTFLPGLIANSWGPRLAVGSEGAGGAASEGSTFPGGALMSLELLAMWISWVRKLYTADGTLRLSKKLFEAIESWAGENGSSGSRWGDGPWKKVTGNTAGTQQQQRVVSKGSGKQDQQDMTVNSGEEEMVKNDRHMVSDSSSSAVVREETREVEQGEVEEGAQSGTATVQEDERCKGGGGMHRGEREEWKQVADLSRRLVEDFGRFPFADEEWKEVRAISVGTGGHSDAGEKSEAPAQTSSTDRRDKSPTRNARGGCGSSSTPASDVGRDARVLEREHNDSEPTGELSSPALSSKGDDCSSQAHSPGRVPEIEATPSIVTRAEELKALGNAAFRKEDFHVAREAYSDALALLDRDASPSSPQQPEDTSVSGNVTTLASTTEGGTSHDAKSRAFRGVLYRNRAAVLLRLFDKSVEMRPSAESRRKGMQTRADGSDDEDNEDHGEGVRISSVSAERGRTAGKGRDEEDPEAEFRARALELLAQCESDCEMAIEFDGRDKKAMFRLTRCRELRERCRRGGLAACVEKGRIQWDIRREQRKKELMAKILARTSGAHEVLGGPGGGTAVLLPSRDQFDGSTVEGPKATGGSGVPGGSTKADLRGETERQGSDVERDLTLESNGTSSSARLRPKALDCAAKSMATSLADGQGHTCCAPREGGELLEEETNGRSASEDDFASARAAASTVLAGMGLSPCTVSRGNMRPSEATPPRSETTRPSCAPRACARSLRGSLEYSIARAVKVRGGNGRKTGEVQASSQNDVECTMEVWRYLLTLVSTKVSLGEVLGDGITEELFEGIVRALGHACGRAGASQNPTGREADGGQLGERTGDESDNTILMKHVHQLFLELGSVRRVGVMGAMCSPEVRQTLETVYKRLRLLCHHPCGEATEKQTTDGIMANDSGEKGRPRRVDDAGLNRSGVSALEAAATNLGLDR